MVRGGHLPLNVQHALVLGKVGEGGGITSNPSHPLLVPQWSEGFLSLEKAGLTRDPQTSGSWEV